MFFSAVKSHGLDLSNALSSIWKMIAAMRVLCGRGPCCVQAAHEKSRKECSPHSR